MSYFVNHPSQPGFAGIKQEGKEMYPYKGYQPGDTPDTWGRICGIVAAVLLVLALSFTITGCMSKPAYATDCEAPKPTFSVAHECLEKHSPFTVIEVRTGLDAVRIAEATWPTDDDNDTVTEIILATTPEAPFVRVIAFINHKLVAFRDIPKPVRPGV